MKLGGGLCIGAGVELGDTGNYWEKVGAGGGVCVSSHPAPSPDPSHALTPTLPPPYPPANTHTPPLPLPIPPPHQGSPRGHRSPRNKAPPNRTASPEALPAAPPPAPAPADRSPRSLFIPSPSFTHSLLFLERGKEGKKKKEKKNTEREEAGACFASQAIFLEPIGMRTHPALLPN